MSAATPPVPVPGAAGWILAAGAALSMHVAAGAALVLALAGPPQAPAAAHGGVVIRNVTAVTATAPRPGRARPEAVAPRRADTAPGDRLAALDEAVPRRAAEVPARTAALAPERRAAAQDGARRLTPAAGNRQMSGEVAPRRAPAAAGARSMAQQDAPRRVAPAAAAPRATGEPAPRRLAVVKQGRPEAAQKTAPRRVAPGAQDRPQDRQEAAQEFAQEIAPRRVAQETPENAGAAAAVRQLSAGGARRAATDAARPAPPGDTVRPQAAAQRTPQRALQRAPQRAPETRAGRTPERSRSTISPPPPEPAPRRSRARRAGPDRRLSDRQAAPARDAGTVALEQMRTVLADLHGTPCHLVLPLPEGMPGFAAIGADPARLAAAGARLDRAFGRDTRPVLATHAVAGGQCAAVDFVHASRDDPRRGLGLDLWRPAAGEDRPLTGTLLHGATGALQLLLIDSAGQVHDLGDFLRPVPDGSHFSIPMSAAGAAGEARQLLLAIVTPTPLQTLPPAAAPVAARPFFADLGQELERLGMVPDLALAAFVLE